jgi:hypothetical protein
MPPSNAAGLRVGTADRGERRERCRENERPLEALERLARLHEAAWTDAEFAARPALDS